ncbi:LOW QUALITY PROTEIN: polycystic kidney disease protein 1-like 3 [Drosophila ficusphila]|uniref:LOW QUALITY PROTEIN: polycystic kidney disease protein 1-like 3 n=1 Tax=Drosophila ficusphila TaxID=30025 RepID=UPI001C8A3A7E|nr:LOW QUALITY PROTEIN: polycystic kidney disease protein 1-like 3 [Drosophila ficusphila]
MAFKNVRPKDLVCFGVTLFVLLVCFTLIAIFSGFVHEPQRFRTMLVTIVLVFFCQFLIYEPIRYLVQAVDYATWPREDPPIKAEKGDAEANHITLLKIQVRGLRSELVITEGHQNEMLNRRYKHISGDLLLFGSFFLTLMFLVVTQESQEYYFNTNNMHRLFFDNTSVSFGLSQVYYLYQIHLFLKITMVESFFVKDVQGHEGWWAMEQWQRIGVVRLRQVRQLDAHIGWGKPKWDKKTYAPEWKLPYHRLHYTDKFWRIYDPFIPADFRPTFLNGLLLNFDHHGYLNNYPERRGYVVLMMSAKINCLKQVEYLREYGWLSRNTSALFIDFAMYNADANVFTVFTLRVENTPFGVQISRAHVDTVKMLATVEMRTSWELLVLCVYAILIISFARGVLSRLWHDPRAIRESWTIVDVGICLLNAFLLGLTLMRDMETDNLLKMVETYTRGQYLDFQRPLRLHQLLAMVKGFLICITTLRLWKVLQFAAVFQHFSRTLFSAWRAVASLGLIILVLLMGIGMALAVPNGNNAEVFHHIIAAVITCMWYSVGFNAGVRPTEFFHGGVFLGLLLYLVLVFLVAIILLNVFASVIYDYFEETGRELKEQAGRKHITFMEFLRVEYMNLWGRCFRCVDHGYNRHGRTVSENVELSLRKRERKRLQKEERSGKASFPQERLSNEERHADYLRRGDRIFKLMAILNIQLEIFERLVLGDEDGNLPSPAGSDSDPEDMPEMYRKRQKSDT